MARVFKIMSDVKTKEEALTDLTDLCGVDEVTAKLWLEDPDYFESLEPVGERDDALIFKGFMLGRASTEKKGRLEREVAEERILDSHETEFPMSTRKLAALLEVSHPTVMRAGHKIDATGPYDKIACFLIADEVLGCVDEVEEYEGPR